jgi:hypothetical protein
MLIGLDFDNTIADYRLAFVAAGRALGMAAAAGGLGKREIRDRLGGGEDGERAWQRLQGQVYGRHIGDARLFPGFAEWVGRARRRGARLKIISHKTQFGHFDPDRIDLRTAARDWMAANGFFASEGLGFAGEDVHFLPDRDAKVAMISALGCSHFIDDLPEVLLHPAFPPATVALLFAPGGAEPGCPLPAYRRWADLAEALFP